MSVYKELYYKLFGVIADAVDAIENGEPDTARNKLIACMNDTEDAVISSDVDI